VNSYNQKLQQAGKMAVALEHFVPAIYPISTDYGVK